MGSRKWPKIMDFRVNLVGINMGSRLGSSRIFHHPIFPDFSSWHPRRSESFGGGRTRSSWTQTIRVWSARSMEPATFSSEFFSKAIGSTIPKFTIHGRFLALQNVGGLLNCFKRTFSIYPTLSSSLGWMCEKRWIVCFSRPSLGREAKTRGPLKPRPAICVSSPEKVICLGFGWFLTMVMNWKLRGPYMPLSYFSPELNKGELSFWAFDNIQNNILLMQIVFFFLPLPPSVHHNVYTCVYTHIYIIYPSIYPSI